MIRLPHAASHALRGFAVVVALASTQAVGCSVESGRSSGAGRETIASTAEPLTSKCGAPASGPVQGRDVSVFQGAFDWSGAKAGGVSFGYARVSDGTTILDDTFPGNWTAMKDAGVLRGAYQFFEPSEDEVAQANLLVQAVGGRLGDGDLPAVIDVEVAGGQAPATIAAKVAHWLQIVEAATGKRPWIYTGAYFWQDNVGDTSFGAYPLFIAAYGPVCPSIPDGWSDWTLWQYSDGGGALDHDVFNGSSAMLQAFARSDDAAAFPPIARRSATDVNGDGFSDVCGRSPAGIVCELGGKGGSFAELHGPAWSDSSSWNGAGYASTVQLGDLDGDGKADICGRSAAGLECWLSDGHGFPTSIPGPPWSDAQGWNEAQYYATIQLGDVDGDGKVDACARGWAGIECYLSDGKGFPTKIIGPAWSNPAGWDRPQYYATIQLADVNGDGKDDVCGRGAAGVECWLSDGHGFPTKIAGPAWSDATAWAAPASGSTLRFVDIDGDKKADLCARASAGIRCVLSNGHGFGDEIAGPDFSDATGWNEPRFYGTILYPDVDGDGRADVCARSHGGIECSLFDGKAFGPRFAGPAWSDADGWNEPAQYRTIGAADIDRDGKDDLCGRSKAGLVCALSTGHGFAPAVAGPAWADAAGWGSPSSFGSIRYAGAPSAAPGAPHPGVVTPDGGAATSPPGTRTIPPVDPDAASATSGGCSLGTTTHRHGESQPALLVLVAGLVAARLRRARAARRTDRRRDSP